MDRFEYEYDIITHDHIEGLLPLLNTMGKDGWTIVGTIQEHAYTKIILERENHV